MPCDLEEDGHFDCDGNSDDEEEALLDCDKNSCEKLSTDDEDDLFGEETDEEDAEAKAGDNGYGLQNGDDAFGGHDSEAEYAGEKLFRGGKCARTSSQVVPDWNPVWVTSGFDTHHSRLECDVGNDNDTDSAALEASERSGSAANASVSGELPAAPSVKPSSRAVIDFANDGDIGSADSTAPTRNIGWNPSLLQVLEERAATNTTGYVVAKRDVSFLAHRLATSASGKCRLMRDAADFYSKPTDLACLWCTEPFQTLPVPKAIRYKQANAKFYFTVTGQYCSPSCALADTEPREQMVTEFMFRVVYGVGRRIQGTREMALIVRAPPRESLAKFGGFYTIEQFRATCSAGIVTTPIALPFLPQFAGMHEIERIKAVFTDVLTPEQIKSAFQNGIRMETQTGFVPNNANFFHGAGPRYNHRKENHLHGNNGNASGPAGGSNNSRRTRASGKSRRETAFGRYPKTLRGRRTGQATDAHAKQKLDDAQQETPQCPEPVTMSIEDQLRQSRDRLRLQRKELDVVLRTKRKRSTLMRYMEKVDCGVQNQQSSAAD